MDNINIDNQLIGMFNVNLYSCVSSASLWAQG